MTPSRRSDERLLDILSRLRAGEALYVTKSEKDQIIAIVDEDMKSGDDPIEVAKHYPEITELV